MIIPYDDHFLLYIDSLKKTLTECDTYIDKMGYHYYIDIETDEYTTENTFICLKRQYVHFLIKDNNGVKFYLDDHDIIKMLIDLKVSHNDLYNHIFSGFVDFLNDKCYDFEFKLNEYTFNYPGIEYLESTINISTKADVNISFNDFVHLINLILAKESFGSNSPKNIVCKYLTLTSYYGEGDFDSKQILEKCKFNTSKSFEQAKSQIAVAGKYKFVVDYDVFQNHFNL